MRIQNNIAALNSHRQLGANNTAVGKNLEKLSSGFRINRAGDDAAGLAISEKMRAQIKGLETATKNANDGISLVQTAEGALTEVHSMLNRMVELATQSANGTYDNSVDRANLQKEVEALKSEIGRISDSTNYNGIKLLDGSLDAKISNAASASTASVNLSDGVTINAPIEGAGAKNEQSFSLNFGDDALLGADDKVTVNFTKADGTADKVEVTGFAGTDAKAQLQEIADAINLDADINTAYEASVKTDETGASKVVLTAKAEGAATLTFGAVSVDDKQVAMVVTSNPADIVAGEDASHSGGTEAVNTTGGVDDLVMNTANPQDSNDISAGDKLTFTFNVNGKEQSVTLTATNKAPADLEANEFAMGADLEETTANIATALKAASFADKADTGIDESMLKVDDYFTINANTKSDGTANTYGSVQILNKVIGENDTDFSLSGVKIENQKVAGDGTVSYDAPVGIGTSVAGTGGTSYDTGAVAAKSTFLLNNSFADGESVTFSGRLADGKDFSVTLTASTKDAADLGANEFKIGATTEETLDNIKAALEKDTTVVTTTNVTTSEKATVAADKLFGADATDEFTITKTAANDGLSFTSKTAGAVGAGKASGITSVTTNTKDAITGNAATADVAGKVQSNAENTITFDAEKIEEGTTFSIDGKTFEFVTDAANVSKTGNIAVEIANLGKRDGDGNLASDAATSNDIANAVMKALDSDNVVTAGADKTTGEYTSADGKAYDLSVDAGSGALKITSQATGTDAHPLSGVSASAGNRDIAVVNFQTTTEGTGADAKEVLNVKVGDTIEINGKTYEFVADGERTTDKNSVGVTLDGTETKPEDVAAKLAAAINTNDGDKTIASVNAKTGAVEIASKFDKYAEEGQEYKAPEVKLPNSSEGLALQVGETSDAFQKVSVQVGSMNVDSLGIKDVNVGTQAGAHEAIDKIKDAINTVSATRGDLGAIQNRLEHTMNNLGVAQENMTAAESRIRDVDMAKEMMNFTKNNILVQASQAMLAQANQLPQGVLQLLQ